jgi:DNA replication protein DnaC
VPAGEGGRLPRAEDAGGLRLRVQPVDKEEADLRSGDVQVHSRGARRALLGPPGTGKSHLVQALGYQAIKAGHTVLYRSIFDVVRDFLHDEALGGEEKVLNRYLKPDLVIVDDMGMKQLPKRSGEYLFEIIMRRHEVRSTMMTSNRPLEDWGKLLGDVPSATAILDRFLQHAEIITITGKSYRLRNKRADNKTSRNAHREDRPVLTRPPMAASNLPGDNRARFQDHRRVRHL